MRRIYESDALHRDDDPHTPNEKDTSRRVQAVRWVNSTLLSRLLLPTGIAYRAVSVDISTPNDEFAPGESVPFVVTMKNSLPTPVTIPTESLVLWTWTVDGVPEASHVPLRDPPDERGAFVFDRGERKQFHKRWDQRFKVGNDEWEAADPGTYTLGAEFNVPAADEKGLSSETIVEIRSD
ncbi:hypothetical protein [Natronolimnohabitans innermongolicus]|uniref:DUF7974 domain-containing protein n=1 Tax=Natronolimnohabitans innermongolicus JCM 12255 TaxID=1227499 RepID=L9XD49_9EURY|nr:hypothetical protein [Natronolimnohabitans innermongolicus]ELY59639.1 hypothetical protein C493_04943 [Natronolimnohabitans innermongolicus JCM 12255]